ncbi:hypothetical protein ACFP82_17235 [Cellulomonas gelida]|uniref:hypothetical protein n=1 Tax=Cellulomonas gelida TaxID=1712 RepID=UPI00360D4594
MPEPGGSGLRDALLEHGILDPDERRRLQMEAAAFDELMLAAPPAAESFGVLVELGVDGMVAVEAAEEQDLPPLLQGLPWTAQGVVAYRVRWEPLLIEELELEKPSFEHRVARTRSAPRGAGDRAGDPRRGRRGDRRRGRLPHRPRRPLTRRRRVTHAKLSAPR